MYNGRNELVRYVIKDGYYDGITNFLWDFGPVSKSILLDSHLSFETVMPDAVTILLDDVLPNPADAVN